MSYIYNLSDTWNDGATVFTAIKMNVTNTASAVNSKLIDLQVGGTTYFNVGPTGNVGIGLVSPAALLHLNKTSGACDIRLSVGNTLYGSIYSSATDTNIYSVQALPLILGTNNTERVRIDASGNVGIGTAAPVSKFEVKGTGTVAASISGDSTGEAQIRFNTNTLTRITQQSNQAMLFETNATERVRVTSTGNVGIGTNAPAALLDVNGTVIISHGYTVATLPTGSTGMRAYVTDALAPTYLSAVVGGGTVKCPVFYNGAAWIVA